LPSMLSGAVLGRFLGEICRGFLSELDVQPGLLAFMGAATVLGGVFRMPVSLTVIMCEATNQASYTLFVMAAMMIAKSVGDLIMPGITHIGFKLKQYPILQWDTPSVFKFHRVKEIMNHPVVTLNKVESIRQIVTVLFRTTHNGFPVVDHPDSSDAESPRRLLGVVLRTQLEDLLLSDELSSKVRYLLDNDIEFASSPNRTGTFSSPFSGDFSPPSTHITTPGDAEDSVGDESIHKEFDETDLSTPSVDLSDLYNHCLTVHKEVSCSRVFTLFRQIGLRHLVVVNPENVPIGMVTRKDLFFLHSDLKDNRQEKQTCWARFQTKLYGS